jgi:molybdopterin adenylyltransferase
MKIAILTVSDGVTSGTRTDRSGPAIREVVERAGHEVVAAAAVPDEPLTVSRFLIEHADGGDVELILTTGGTGFAPRDVTPEATRAVLDREAPGLAAALLATSLAHTPMAALSRAVAGIRGRTLILNLPGSPRAITECLTPEFMKVLGHGVDLLHDRTGEHPR